MLSEPREGRRGQMENILSRVVTFWELRRPEAGALLGSCLYLKKTVLCNQRIKTKLIKNHGRKSNSVE